MPRTDLWADSDVLFFQFGGQGRGWDEVQDLCGPKERNNTYPNQKINVTKI